ncbi:MFS transporter [Candidatus Woesearchaeota archaeon]|nr:MFS transporter [Candidatus Woesearchaeota archaeon]
MVTQKQRKRALAYSNLDAGFFSAMVGFGESVFQLFAIFLKASPIQLGLLASIPQMIGAINQIFSRNYLSLFKTRKALVLSAVLLQSLAFLPLALTYFFTKDFWYMFIFVSIYWTAGMVATPAWTSWIGDLVPKKIRGTYFGKRNARAGAISFATMLIASLFLWYLEANPFIAFAILFIVASSMRLISGLFLSLQFEPEYKIVKERPISLKEFTKRANLKNYGIYIILGSMMNFFVFIAAPFFILYKKETALLSAGMILVSQSFFILAKCIFVPAWGSLCDKYGSNKIFRFATIAVGIVPLLFFGPKNILYICLIEFISGFVWASYEISSANFIFEMVPKEKRITMLSYFHFFNSFAMVVGSILGSLLMTISWMNPYILVFSLSAAGRLFVGIMFAPRLKEVRAVEDISYKRLIYGAISTSLHSSGIGDFKLPRISKQSNKLKDIPKKYTLRT